MVTHSIENRLIIKIDKKLQAQKREKVGSFYVPEHMMDYTNNLQFGTVVSFGYNVKKNIPEIEIGDVAIIDHSVEFKVESTNKRDDSGSANEEDKALVYIDENGDEIRHLLVGDDHVSKLFGIYKDGKIIPAKNMIFCSIEAKISDFQLKNGIYINSVESKQPIIDALEVASHAKTEFSNVRAKIPRTELHGQYFEDLEGHISRIEKEMEELTARLNKVELAEVTVLFSNARDNHGINKGDVVLLDEKFVYPIDLFGSRFIIIRNSDWVVAKKRKIILKNKKTKSITMSQKKLELGPLSNRVIIKQDEAEKKKGKLHIADTAQVKPNTGIVMVAGPGYSKDFPMELKVNDRVMFEKHSGIEVIIDDEEYLIVRDIAVICTLLNPNTKADLK